MSVKPQHVRFDYTISNFFKGSVILFIHGKNACSSTPGNPCASNPCMNGGMCASNKGHQFTCHCQQAWTGPTCNQGEFLFSSVWQFDGLRLAFRFMDSMKYNIVINVQMWMSVRGTPAPSGPGVWTREAPSAVNVRLASTWRTDAPAPEVKPL